MERIAHFVTGILVKRRIITEDERIYYDYGFESTINELLIFLTILLISIMTRQLIVTLCYTVLFGILHTKTGGYHCKTYFKCYLLSVSLYVGMLFMSTQLMYTKRTATLFMMFSMLIFWILTPMKENVKIKGKYLKNNRITLIIYGIVSLVTINILILRTAFLLATSITLILVCLGYFYEKIKSAVWKHV